MENNNGKGNIGKTRISTNNNKKTLSHQNNFFLNQPTILDDNMAIAKNTRTTIYNISQREPCKRKDGL